jgi:hypothetical protein
VSSEEIKAAAGRAKHDSIHVLLEDGYRNKVIAELTKSVTGAVDPVSCAVAVQGFDAFDKMLTRGAFAAPVTNGQRRTLMEARESLVASLRGQIMTLLQALERDLLSKAIDVSSKDIRRVATQVHELSVWALRAEDEESVRLARLFTPGGALEHWARRCEDQRFEAGTAAERANVIWGLLYLASFAVWGVSLLLLRENIKVAVGVWVGSFVLWLVTRDHRDTPTTWKDKFSPPTPPIVPRSVR